MQWFRLFSLVQYAFTYISSTKSYMDMASTLLTFTYPLLSAGFPICHPLPEGRTCRSLLLPQVVVSHAFFHTGSVALPVHSSEHDPVIAVVAGEFRARVYMASSASYVRMYGRLTS